MFSSTPLGSVCLDVFGDVDNPLFSVAFIYSLNPYLVQFLQSVTLCCFFKIETPGTPPRIIIVVFGWKMPVEFGKWHSEAKGPNPEHKW